MAASDPGRVLAAWAGATTAVEAGGGAATAAGVGAVVEAIGPALHDAPNTTLGAARVIPATAKITFFNISPSSASKPTLNGAYALLLSESDVVAHATASAELDERGWPLLGHWAIPAKEARPALPYFGVVGPSRSALGAAEN
jgi:hypothetical protein